MNGAAVGGLKKAAPFRPDMTVASEVTPIPKPQPSGKVWYVDPDGEDIPEGGTNVRPWKTLSYASAAVKTYGDVIHLNKGVYNESAVSKIAPGVSVRGEGPEKSLLIYSEGVHYALTLHSIGPDVQGDQVIEGFSINGSGKKLGTGISVRSRDNVTICDIHFNMIDFTALQVLANGYSKEKEPEDYLEHIHIYDITITDCGGADMGTWGSAALYYGGIKDSLLHDITIDNSGTRIGEGISQYGGGWARNLKVYNCDIKVYDSLYWDKASSLCLINSLNECEVFNVRANTWFSLCNNGSLKNREEGEYSLKVHHNSIIQEERTAEQLAEKVKRMSESKETPWNRNRTPSQYINIEAGLSNFELCYNYFENPGEHGIAVWPGDGIVSGIKIHHNTVYGGNVNSHTFLKVTPMTGGGAENIYIHDNTIIGNVAFPIQLIGQSDGYFIKNIFVFDNIFANLSEDEHFAVVNIVNENRVAYVSLQNNWIANYRSHYSLPRKKTYIDKENMNEMPAILQLSLGGVF